MMKDSGSYNVSYVNNGFDEKTKENPDEENPVKFRKVVSIDETAKEATVPIKIRMNPNDPNGITNASSFFLLLGTQLG